MSAASSPERAATRASKASGRKRSEADLRSVSHLGDAFCQILVVDEDDVAAGLAHDRGRVLPPHDVDGPVPAVPGKLHQVQAHGRVGRILDDPIALPNVTNPLNSSAAVGGLIVIIDSCSGSASLGSGVSCAASVTTWVDQVPQPTGSKTRWPTATPRASSPSSATFLTPAAPIAGSGGNCPSQPLPGWRELGRNHCLSPRRDAETDFLPPAG